MKNTIVVLLVALGISALSASHAAPALTGKVNFADFNKELKYSAVVPVGYQLGAIAEYGKGTPEHPEDIRPARIFLILRDNQKPDETTAVFEYGDSGADPMTTMERLTTRKKWKSKPQAVNINGLQGCKTVEPSGKKTGMIVVLRNNKQSVVFTVPPVDGALFEKYNRLVMSVRKN